LAGYTRARPVAHWLDFPDTTYGTVGSAEFGKWDTAIYELKTLAANPLDFGAVGGGGDETAILNNALASGKDVFLPPGYVFGTTGITVSTVGQRIFGGGTIRLLGGGSLVGISVAATDVSVDGIILDQQNILNSVGVELTGAAQRCRVFGNRFTNYKVAGVHLAGACSDLLIQGNRYNGQGYGILSADASTCARVAVIGNVLVGGVYGDGIEFNTPTGGATDIVIVGNTVYGYTSAGPNDGIGIGFAHVIGGLIADNLVYNCGLDGIHLEDGSAGVTISGNTVRGCGRSGIAVNSGNAALAYPSTFKDLQDNVIAKVRLDATADRPKVKDWINRYYSRICVENEVTQTSATMVVTAGVASYTLPARSCGSKTSSGHPPAAGTGLRWRRCRSTRSLRGGRPARSPRSRTRRQPGMRSSGRTSSSCSRHRRTPTRC
jgi:parallel beta-helix repeat protein